MVSDTVELVEEKYRLSRTLCCCSDKMIRAVQTHEILVYVRPTAPVRLADCVRPTAPVRLADCVRPS